MCVIWWSVISHFLLSYIFFTYICSLFNYVQQSDNPDTFEHFLEAVQLEHKFLKEKLELRLSSTQQHTVGTSAHGHNVLFRCHPHHCSRPQNNEEMRIIAQCPRFDDREESSSCESLTMVKQREHANSMLSFQDNQPHGDEFSDYGSDCRDWGGTTHSAGNFSFEDYNFTGRVGEKDGRHQHPNSSRRKCEPDSNVLLSSRRMQDSVIHGKEERTSWLISP